MIKVIIKEQNFDVVDVENVIVERPVFVKQQGQFIGMIMYDEEDNLFYVQCGPENRLNINSDIHSGLMKKLIRAGYELFVGDYRVKDILDEW